MIYDFKALLILIKSFALRILGRINHSVIRMVKHVVALALVL